MILDGWGIGKHDKGDVIYKTPTPYLDYLTAVSAHSTLQTCGEDVGLPNGQMGNSEVGHLNIGAGRVVYQDLVKINKACESGDILKNQEIINAYSYAQKTGKKLHLMGLTSTGGVHSSLDHLFKLIEIGKEYIFNYRIESIGDLDDDIALCIDNDGLNCRVIEYKGLNAFGHLYEVESAQYHIPI